MKREEYKSTRMWKYYFYGHIEKVKKLQKKRKKIKKRKIETNNLTVSMNNAYNLGRKHSPLRLKNWTSQKNVESVNSPQ